jgi:hypothetical protein
MRVIAAFFGPYAPDALPSHGSVFSHDFKRFERLTKLATSSLCAPWINPQDVSASFSWWLAVTRTKMVKAGLWYCARIGGALGDRWRPR